MEWANFEVSCCVSLPQSISWAVLKRHHDTFTQRNDIQHICDTQHNDTQHYGRALLCRVSFMLCVTCAECHYAECHYAECHYAECRYTECCGASKTVWLNKKWRLNECYVIWNCISHITPLLQMCRKRFLYNFFSSNQRSLLRPL